MPKCGKCGRQLAEGDEAFVTEWKDIKTIKSDYTVKVVKKYECAPKCP